jgi:hypothetical protein
MMHSPDIPEQVLRFVAEKIDTVPHLEALLLLWENQGRTWDCEEVAARIYVRADVSTDILQTLHRRDLLTVDDPSTPRYRYNTGWDKSGELMTQVVEAYRHHLVQIATFIHSRGSSSVREFARAFDLKKER